MDTRCRQKATGKKDDGSGRGGGGGLTSLLIYKIFTNDMKEQTYYNIEHFEWVPFLFCAPLLKKQTMLHHA